MIARAGGPSRTRTSGAAPAPGQSCANRGEDLIRVPIRTWNGVDRDQVRTQRAGQLSSGVEDSARRIRIIDRAQDHLRHCRFPDASPRQEGDFVAP